MGTVYVQLLIVSSVMTVHIPDLGCGGYSDASRNMWRRNQRGSGLELGVHSSPLLEERVLFEV